MRELLYGISFLTVGALGIGLGGGAIGDWVMAPLTTVMGYEVTPFRIMSVIPFLVGAGIVLSEISGANVPVVSDAAGMLEDINPIY
ncbi:MAG: hypothetical protein CL398_00160 [Acidiferrobacteraceae bacterium]|nr:hypothetical protein [Acidiferrobacteraceae bacterium]|tara:strand:+ start:505 stop:762 length:258 start_codon:yes stop_codon:yes gene_type:complete